MHVPQEILDQIVQYLFDYDPVDMMSAQTSVYTWDLSKHDSGTLDWDLFISCSYDPQSDDGFNEADIPLLNPGGHAFTYPQFYTLYKVRLVSRAWNAAASRLLAKHIWWLAEMEPASKLERAINLASSLTRKLDMGRIAQVRREDDLYRDEFYEDRLEFSECRDSEYTLQRQIDREAGLIEDADWSEGHEERQHEQTRRLIDNLQRGEGLSAAFPLAQSEYCFEGFTQTGRAHCYDMDILDMALETIAYGLRSPAFQYLTSLRLTVPSTYYIKQLAASMTPSVKEQLKDLYLAVNDETGPGGSEQYFAEYDVDGTGERWLDGTLTDVESSKYKSSLVQLEYPNREHQDSMWDFIRDCKNLEFLGVQCTHYLDLERLKWEPGPNSKGLRGLYLKRVYAKAWTIRRLLKPREAASRVQRVEFCDVKIYKDGGDWSTVYDCLISHCPKLEFYSSADIGYFFAHPSHRPLSTRAEESAEIWSISKKDIRQHIALMRKMLIQAGINTRYPGGQRVRRFVAWFCFPRDCWNSTRNWYRFLRVPHLDYLLLDM
ncbi:hypothetical protein F5Y16DRAFT_164884 [Xylariaceae sp. FL0255]|nr:hypothetical protein F5Y16DRAFT_164884 [Xylariaceae sp. FL0255]